MTVTINTSNITAESLCKSFGLNPKYADVLGKHLGKIVVEPSYVKIVNSAGDVIASAKIKLGVVQMAHDGLLGNIATNKMSASLVDAFESMMLLYGYPNKYTGTDLGKNEGGGAMPNPPMSLGTSLGDLLKEKTTTKEKNEDTLEMEANAPDLVSKPFAAVVDLVDATTLYQQVHGSDSGSKYFAVALGPEVNVAVRIKNKNKYVSFRVEGPELTSKAPYLKTIGLKKAGPKHMSLHVAAQTKPMALKVVGALLFAIDAKFDKVATDLSSIIGKGA